MRRRYTTLIFLTFLLYLPFLALAANDMWGTSGLINTIFINWFGFPREWISSPNSMIYYGIIPFAGVWMIIYGFLTAIQIFGDKDRLYLALSFLIAFSTLPLRIFTLIVATIFAFMGVWSTGLFALVFIVGVLGLSMGKIRESRHSISKGWDTIDNRIDRMKIRKYELTEKLSKLPVNASDAQRNKIMEQLDEVDKSINELEKRKKIIKES